MRAARSLRLFGMVAALSAQGALAQGPDERPLLMPDGTTRYYLLNLPNNFDPEVGAPCVFDFHGAGGNPNNQRRYSNLGALANRDGVILVNPNSRTSERPTKSAWHGTLYQPEDKADVEFVLALVRVMEQDYGATSFFAVGMSSGGDIASSLACQPDSPFDGFGGVTYAYYWGENPQGSGQPGSPLYNGGSAQLTPPSMLDTPPPSRVTSAPTVEDCAAHRQGRRFIYFHGTEDRVCPYLGDRSPWWDPPREEIAKRWGRHNQCEGDWVEEQVSDLALRYTWPTCGLAPTVFYKIRDFGHIWPGSNGETRSGIDASELMWDFFGLSGGGGSVYHNATNATASPAARRRLS